MNLVVHSARHPELRDYIHSAVSGLHPFIQKVDPLLIYFLLLFSSKISHISHVFENSA
ncbi:unnamed protein product [Prunus brigantina]